MASWFLQSSGLSWSPSLAHSGYTAGISYLPASVRNGTSWLLLSCHLNSTYLSEPGKKTTVWPLSLRVF